MRKNNWLQVGGKLYYAGKNGAIVTGWQTINKKKFYFQKDGTMRKNNWLKVSGKLYYAGKNGAIVTGWQTINGKRFHFDKNGVLIK